jgi:hypothetical protein
MASILTALAGAASELTTSLSTVATSTSSCADAARSLVDRGQWRSALGHLRDGLAAVGELSRSLLREVQEAIRMWDKAASSPEGQRDAAALIAAAEAACSRGAEYPSPGVGGTGAGALDDGISSGSMGASKATESAMTSDMGTLRKWEVHLNENERFFKEDKFVQQHQGISFVVELPAVIRFSDRAPRATAHTVQVRCSRMCCTCGWCTAGAGAAGAAGWCGCCRCCLWWWWCSCCRGGACALGELVPMLTALANAQ